jgi:FKBP-type peptidyl-prolyl cis-trans isomerase 2
LLLALACACSRGPDGTIHPGSTVRLDYTLAVDGKPFESTEIHGPIEIIQGHGDLPAAVDRGLLGMRVGQRGDFEIPAGIGFGYHEASKIESLPLASMGALAEDVKAGKKILGFKDGKPVEGRVLEVRDGAARVDFNHPLADKALRYHVQIVEIDPRPE